MHAPNKENKLAIHPYRSFARAYNRDSNDHRRPFEWSNPDFSAESSPTSGANLLLVGGEYEVCALSA
jgi:hypothetical protein